MSLRLQFWGTRGSIPSPGSATVRYGGNTPCLELRTSDGWLVILDAGTGLRELGRSLIARANGAPIKGDIFLTHAHWDHIQGLPFFGPIFQRGNHYTIWGSKSLETSIDRVVRDQMSPVVFPVTFEELDATVDFRELAEEQSDGNGYRVRAFQVRHPGGALGYRFEERNGDGRALVYIPDNEISPTARYEQTPLGWRDALVSFARGAAVLVHDTMYTAEEYDHYRGWGHSTYADAVELAIDAGVEQLVLFHHKPERTDADVERRAAECRALARRRGSALEIVAAAEGLTLTV
ncbi:MAG TPA: MBL fold metallo-hydrolase [Gemmatimonadaceae bacterium]|nr:MBL fold metallo-hydrolase [Gemmatimonadaceae bacterium]